MSILHRFGARCIALIERLESVPVGLWGWLFGMSAVVVLRNFLEGLSQRALNILDADNAMFFPHAWAFYVVAFLGIILILRFLTGERIVRVSTFVLFLAPIILLPPLFDLAVTGGAGGVIGYIDPAVTLHSAGNIIGAVVDFSLWGPFGLLFPMGGVPDDSAIRMNFGIRIEVMLLFAALAWYLYIKTRNAARVILGVVMLYAGLFTLATFPHVVTEPFGVSVYALFAGSLVVNTAFRGANTVLFGCLFALLVALGLLWFRANDRRTFAAVWKNIRLSRLVIGNFGMLTAGLIIGISSSSSPLTPDIFDHLLVLFAYASVLFGWIWAVARNDLADERGDRISESFRPLPSGALTRNDMRETGRLALFVSLVAAFLAGFHFFLLRIVWMCIAYLYSEPPFRLKRFPLLSNVVLAGAYCITMVAGYVLVARNNIFDFPSGIACLMLVSLPLLMEFKNIKDYEGDRADGVITIPVLFGLERGKRVIAGFGVLAFLLLPFVYPARFAQLFLVGSALALWYVYAVTVKPYREWRVFLVLSAGILIAAWLGIIGS
ncbi:MAG: hypothetical protein RL681_446 [Candidatus Parcubacteria bacterium]|jgi:4-hydroxybenzoate polyprenyltransferase